MKRKSSKGAHSLICEVFFFSTFLILIASLGGRGVTLPGLQMRKGEGVTALGSHRLEAGVPAVWGLGSVASLGREFSLDGWSTLASDHLA